MRKYYSMEAGEREASISIYGEITSWPWLESDVSSYNLSKAIEGLDVDTIHVYMNSPGGEVAEGIAIYNALKRHRAKVVTYADGFVCSIAATIFAAGDERVMYDTSLLMIHNAWSRAAGNAEELRKLADDLETINETSKTALLSIVNIGEDELQKMLDNETWIPAAEALEKGFATRIGTLEPSEKVSANANAAIYNRLMGAVDLSAVMREIGAVNEYIKAISANKPQEKPKNDNFWNAFSRKGN